MLVSLLDTSYTYNLITTLDAYELPQHGVSIANKQV